MLLLFFSLFILHSSSFSVSSPVGLQMLSELKYEVFFLPTDVPKNAGDYISDIKSYGKINAESFDVSQIDEILLTKLQIPDKAYTKFKNILFSKEIHFQTFSFSTILNQGSLTEFIGTARRNGSIADIAYAYITTIGNIKMPCQNIEKKKCWKVLFLFNKCETIIECIPRGMIAHEIDIVMEALRADGYRYAVQQLNDHPLVLTSFDENKEKFIMKNMKAYPPKAYPSQPKIELIKDPIEEFNQSILNKTILSEMNSTPIPGFLSASLTSSPPFVNDLIQNLLKSLPKLETDIKKKKSTIVDKIVNRGFENFQQAASMEQYIGVDDKYIDLFLANVKEDLELPSKFESAFDSTMRDVLYGDSNTWIAFDIVFSLNKGTTCKFVCVLARHDEKTSKIDWLIANIRATFDFAPDLFIISQKKSALGGLWNVEEDKVLFAPSYITNQNLKVVFDFFQIITIKRFAELLGVKPANYLQLGNSLSLSPMPLNFIVTEIATGFVLAKASVLAVSLAWKGLVTAFQTTSHTEVLETLKTEGFEIFDTSAQVQKLEGLRDRYYYNFTESLFERIKLPANRSKDLSNVLEDFKFMDQQTWTAYEIVYNVDDNGNCKYVAILANRNPEQGKSNFLITNVEAKFKLGTNLMIVKESKSVGGHIYSEEKMKIQEIPRYVTEDDVKSIFEFFNYVAFKNFGGLLGLDIGYPQVN